MPCFKFCFNAQFRIYSLHLPICRFNDKTKWNKNKTNTYCSCVQVHNCFHFISIQKISFYPFSYLFQQQIIYAIGYFFLQKICTLKLIWTEFYFWWTIQSKPCQNKLSIRTREKNRNSLIKFWSLFSCYINLSRISLA